MDFLEGFLLGPVWSDTEFETRRHTGFYWFVGWLAMAFYLFMVARPAPFKVWLELPGGLLVALFLLLVAALPFAARFYYRQHPIVKGLILLLYGIKHVIAFIFFYQVIKRFWKPDLALLPQQGMEFINTTITYTSEMFRSLVSPTFGMVVGIIAGGMLVVLTLIGLVLAATLLPALYLWLLKLIQYGADLILHRTVLRDPDL